MVLRLVNQLRRSLLCLTSMRSQRWNGRSASMSSIKLGDTISVGVDAKICRVTEQFKHGDETLLHAHYVDLDTGQLMKCPDKRCSGEHTCPIHGRNIRRTEGRIVPQNDIDQLRFYGI